SPTRNSPTRNSPTRNSPTRDAPTRSSPTTAPAHILITGAAGAIGGALARAMRAAWPTARLALLDREQAPLRALADELGTANEYLADLRELDALPALVAKIEEQGPLDGLVNCAGVMRVQQLPSWKWDDAHALLTIDLLAPLRLQDLIVRGMVERASTSPSTSPATSSSAAAFRGLLVNVASMAGRVPLRGCAYYGAAKAGLAMASEIARADLAQYGVRVVTVYPGPVRSALEAGARADYGGGGLLGRFAPTGDPSELAGRIMHAIDHDEPRVIYPRLYGVGWSAPNLSSWIALSYGPPPVS
ncbi:MAG TPA: SDR family NAD(P)-dependent oxidoreductase, partial [Kofleriaceae bacterium]